MCRCSPTPVPFEVQGKKIYGTGFMSQKVSIKGFDLVVLLDGYCGAQFLKAAKPWKSPKVFCFSITDMKAPTDKPEFLKLLDYLWEALQADKKVLIGCMGGHGRTGLVLAALYHRVTGLKDGAVRVRSEYCTKAIESQEQIDYLSTEFDQTPVAVRKKSRQLSGFGFPSDGLWSGVDGFGRQGFYKNTSTGRSTTKPKPVDLLEGSSSLFDKTLNSGKLW